MKLRALNIEKKGKITMNNVIELYPRQKEYFDLFDDCLHKHQSKLLSSEQRAWGKTTILNEIGFTYQALGYDVLLITQCPNSNEHFATDFIDPNGDYHRTLCRTRKNTVAIIDEYDYHVYTDNIERKSWVTFNELLKELGDYNIPYVGFVKL